MLPTTPSTREGYGRIGRAALILVGASIALMALGFFLVLLGATVSRKHRQDQVPGLVLALAVLGGIGAHGIVLVRRGIRNRRTSNPVLLKIDAKMARSLGMTFLFGPCCGLIVLAITRGRPPSEIRDLVLRNGWYFAEAGLLLPVGVAVHELGHWLAAFAVGLSVRTLRIGPVVVDRIDGRYRVELNWTAISSLLGFNRLDLPEQVPSRPRLLAVILGGPAANLVAAAGCHAVGASTHRGSLLGAWMSLAWVLNAYLGLGNLIPFKRPGLVSDGLQALKLLRPPSAADVLLYQIVRKIPTGRPREWGITPKQLLDALEGAGAARSKVLLFAYCISQDTGSADASALLDLALREPNLAKEDRYDLELQAVMRAALILGAPAEARTRFEAVDRSGERKPFYPRLAEATLLLAEGRRAEAQEALANWEGHVRASGLQAPFLLGGNQWALERLRRVLDLPPSSTAPFPTPGKPVECAAVETKEGA